MHNTNRGSIVRDSALSASSPAKCRLEASGSGAVGTHSVVVCKESMRLCLVGT